jgi:hypothetical protein
VGEGHALGGEPDRALDLLGLLAVGPEDDAPDHDRHGDRRQNGEEDRTGQGRHLERDARFAVAVPMAVPVARMPVWGGAV